ncbi:MAG TPA: FIST N-terminal domain-containing protein [Acidobacteriota bacterium]|nr:FIST N-terminal domain-containing protein [Acidobacteriota bacterium]
MIKAGVGQSNNASTVGAVEEAREQAMAQAGIDHADGVAVFFSVDHAAPERKLLETARRIAGTDRIAGCSASGILTQRGELENGHGLAVLVLSSEHMRYQPLWFKPLREHEIDIGAELARVAAPGEATGSLLALFPDTYSGQPQEILESLHDERGFTPVVGAGASENGAAQTTYQLGSGGISSNALAGVHLSGSFQSHIEITQGCQPITAPMIITKAERNLIYEINERPALEVFAGLLKGPLADDIRRALMVLFVGLPADRLINSVAPGKYLVRNIIGIDPEKGILGVAENVTEGEAIIFTMRDGQRAREDLTQMLQRQADNLAGRKPAFGFYFNCCARGSSLYGIPGIDSAYIKQTLGDFPLIGMFGGYELAPLGRANHLFAYTGVLALITEENLS